MVEAFVLKKGFAGTVKRAQMFLFPTDISGAQISYQNSSWHEAVWAGRDVSKLRHLPGEVLRPLQGRQPGSIKVCSAASHICFPLLLMAPHPRLVWLIKRRERMCGQSKLNKWAIKTGGRTTSSRWRVLWCLQCVPAKLRAGEDKGLSGMCYNCGPSTERCLWLLLRGNLMSGIGRGANKPLKWLSMLFLDRYWQRAVLGPSQQKSARLRSFITPKITISSTSARTLTDTVASGERGFPARSGSRNSRCSRHRLRFVLGSCLEKVWQPRQVFQYTHSISA